MAAVLLDRNDGAIAISAMIRGNPDPVRSSGLRADLVIVVFDGVEILDVSGPADVFARAGRLSGRECNLVIASPHGGAVRTNAGFAIADTVRLAELTGRFDTVLVAGGEEAGLRDLAADPEVLAWVGAAASNSRRIGSVCVGAFVLAAAGILEGKRVTTHWAACSLLSAFCPTAQVVPDALFLVDGKVCTSAGVSAGIDLALALIEADHGPEIAAQIARALVLFLRRPGGQSQHSASLAAQQMAGDKMRCLVTWIADHPAEALDVPSLARRANMSERNFARVFRKETGRSPGRFVQEARLARAQTLLEGTDWPLERIADRSGIGSAESLYRLFQRCLRVAPADYRARFSQLRPHGS